MNCPKCDFEESKVIDSRSVQRGENIRRRRECISCSFRFTTYEYIQFKPIIVIKKTGDRQEFDRKKLETSFFLACQKRPISQDLIQNSIKSIEEKINNVSNVEINSSLIGELVMERLRIIDKVAFIRYASVYREFQDIGEFQAQIDDLKE